MRTVRHPAFWDGFGCGRCQDGRVTVTRPADPDLQPEDERCALVQRLDQYRAIAAAALVDVPWQEASARLPQRT